MQNFDAVAPTANPKIAYESSYGKNQNSVRIPLLEDPSSTPNPSEFNETKREKVSKLDALIKDSLMSRRSDRIDAKNINFIANGSQVLFIGKSPKSGKATLCYMPTNLNQLNSKNKNSFVLFFSLLCFFL